MLYLILSWNLLGLVCWMTGRLTLALLRSPLERPGDRLLFSLWLGLVLWAVLLLGLSLASPLTPALGGLAAVAIGWLSLSIRPIGWVWQRGTGRVIFSLLGLELLLALWLSLPVTWLDTGLYHYGVIRWLAQFGAVPGLGLIHDRFGFTSAWFALAAPLNPAEFGSRGTVVANGFVLLLAIVQAALSLRQAIGKQAQLRDWLGVCLSLLLLPMLFFSSLFVELVRSPSPDVPIVLLAIPISSLLLWAAEQPLAQSPHRADAAVLPLILAAGAVAIKLSGLPFLAIALGLYLWRQWRQWRSGGWRRLHELGWVALLLAPVVGYGLLTTGCPLYPSGLLCLDLPWRIPTDYAQEALAAVRGWGKWFGEPPPGVNPLWWNLVQWWNASALNKAMLGLLLASGVLVGWGLRNWRQRRSAGLWVLGLGALGSGFTMATAPGLRFCLGYLVLIPGLLLAQGLSSRDGLGRLLKLGRWTQRSVAQLEGMPNRRSNWGWGAVGLAFGLGMALITIKLIPIGRLPLTDLRSRWLLPPELPKVAFQAGKNNDVDYFYPTRYGQDLCWASPMPCALGPIQYGIRLRVPDLGYRGGFIRSD